MIASPSLGASQRDASGLSTAAAAAAAAASGLGSSFLRGNNTDSGVSAGSSDRGGATEAKHPLVSLSFGSSLGLLTFV